MCNQTPLESNTTCVLYKKKIVFSFPIFTTSHDRNIRFYAGKWTHENGGNFGKLQIRNIFFFLLFCRLHLLCQNGQRTSGNLDQPRQLIKFLIYITMIADSWWLRAVFLMAVDVLLNNQAVSSYTSTISVWDCDTLWRGLCRNDIIFFFFLTEQKQQMLFQVTSSNSVYTEITIVIVLNKTNARNLSYFSVFL